MADTPKIVSGKLADLPKRETPTRTFNKDAAEAYLNVVSVEGQTATDGILHTERTDAEKKAASAKRLVGHVLPDGKRSRTRVYSPDGETGFRWALWLEDAKKKNGAKK